MEIKHHLITSPASDHFDGILSILPSRRAMAPLAQELRALMLVGLRPNLIPIAATDAGKALAVSVLRTSFH